MKKENGITLIALIITIIIMLILVGVTVSVALNGGLFTTAKNAANKTQLETDRETLASAVWGAIDNNGEVYFVILDANLPEGFTGANGTYRKNNNIFLVDKNGNVTLADEEFLLLQRYFLGKNGEEKDIWSLFNDEGKLIDDITTEENESETIEFIGMETVSENEAMVVVKYKEKSIYKITAVYDEETDSLPTKNLALLTKLQGREGQTVPYSYDGTEENEKEWIILYDDGEYIEIASPEVMGSLTLGANDSNAKGTTATEKAIDSYNNAIKRINDYSASLITNPNRVSVRSLGSNPDDPYSENSTRYTSESETFINNFVQYTIESGDRNYENDYYRLLSFNKLPFAEVCWLASRREPVIDRDGGVIINILTHSEGSEGYLDPWDGELIAENGSGSGDLSILPNKSYGVVPVVKLPGNYGL